MVFLLNDILDIFLMISTLLRPYSQFIGLDRKKMSVTIDPAVDAEVRKMVAAAFDKRGFVKKSVASFQDVVIEALNALVIATFLDDSDFQNFVFVVERLTRKAEHIYPAWSLLKQSFRLCDDFRGRFLDPNLEEITLRIKRKMFVKDEYAMETISMLSFIPTLKKVVLPFIELNNEIALFMASKFPGAFYNLKELTLGGSLSDQDLELNIDLLLSTIPTLSVFFLEIGTYDGGDAESALVRKLELTKRFDGKLEIY